MNRFIDSLLLAFKGDIDESFLLTKPTATRSLTSCMMILRRKQAFCIKLNESRIKEAIDLKDDLISYEMKLKDKYKNLIPREILD